MSKILRYPISYAPYSLGDSLNWKRRVLKEQQKRLTSIPYSLGDSIDWKRSILKERAKRLAASNR
jgi:hypothetical protein